MDLKKDLDEYMLLNEDKKSPNFKIHLGVPEIVKPNKLVSWLKGSNGEQQSQNSSWMQAEESCCPKLSRLQRLLGFVVCICLGAFCITISTFYIPVLLFKARKFAMLFSLGSLFFMAALIFLSGFKSLFDQLSSKPRLPISIVYVLSLICTLYFALVAQSTILTVAGATIQIISLVLLLMKSIGSGAASGLNFLGFLVKNSNSNSLPI